MSRLPIRSRYALRQHGSDRTGNPLEHTREVLDERVYGSGQIRTRTQQMQREGHRCQGVVQLMREAVDQLVLAPKACAFCSAATLRRCSVKSRV